MKDYTKATRTYRNYSVERLTADDTCIRGFIRFNPGRHKTWGETMHWNTETQILSATWFKTNGRLMAFNGNAVQSTEMVSGTQPYDLVIE